MAKGRTLLWIGIVLIVAGGAILTWGGPDAGMAVGTTMGLVGVGLLGWWWARGSRSDAPD